MAPKRKTKKNKRSKQHRSHPSLGFIGVSFLFFAVILFHLWGKVQIDFMLRENDKLENKISDLKRTRDAMHIQVNSLKSYSRIREKAKELGLQSVSADQLRSLPVDLSGLDVYSQKPVYPMAYAGFDPFHLQE